MDPAEEEESSPLHPETRYEEELEGPPPPDDKADLSFEEHFQSGDTVLIRSKDELYIILQLFSPTHDCIAPLTVSEIADHYAVVVDIIQNPDPHLNLGNFAVLLLEDSGQDIVLPLNAFRYVRMEVKEVEDEEEVHILPNGSMKTSPQMNEGLLMVQNIAAEYIQQAYRRYQACKHAIKQRRKKSTDKLVLNMAAETITKNLRRVISKVKSKQDLERQRSLRSTTSSIASQPSVVQHFDTTLPLPKHQDQSQPTIQHISSSALTFPSAPATARRDYNHHFSDLEANSHVGDAVPVYEISNILVQDVPNVAWNDANRLYILLEFHQGVNKANFPPLHPVLFKTNTKEQRQSTQVMQWTGSIASFPVSSPPPSSSSSSTQRESLKLFLYHECLAIQDKLVGLADFQIAAHLAAGQSSGSVSLDLYDSTNIVKRKRKGMISFDIQRIQGYPSQSNVSPRLGEDSKCSSSHLSLATKYVDVHEQTAEGVNGFSPSVILAAVDALQAWESGKETPIKHTEKPIQVPKANNKSPESGSGVKNKLQTHITKSSPNTTNSPGKGEDNRLKQMKKTDKDLLDRPPAADETLPPAAAAPSSSSGRPATSINKPKRLLRTFSASSNNTFSSTIISNEDNATLKTSNTINSANLNKTTSLAKTSRTSIYPANTTNPPPAATKSFKLEHDIRYLFDQAFFMALLRLCAGFTMKIKELIVLLDSLEIPVNQELLEIIQNITSKRANGINVSDSAGKWMSKLEEEVVLPINHPASLAASIADIVNQRSFILPDGKVSNGPVLITEIQAIDCIRQLVKLIKGPYTAVRSTVFMVCGQQTGIANLATTAGASIQLCRPKRLSSQSIQQILLAMKLSSSSVIGQDVYEMLQNIDGQEYLNISSQSSQLALHYKLTASVLQARFTVYLYTMQILDAAWEQGIRPHDAIDKTQEDQVMQATKKWKKSLTSTACKSSNDKDNVTYVDLPVLAAFNEQSSPTHYIPRLAMSTPTSPNTITTIQSQQVTTTTIRKSTVKYFQIADAHALFHVYMPLNRAYAWGHSLSSLTTLCNSIGGFFGFQADMSKLNNATTTAGAGQGAGALLSDTMTTSSATSNTNNSASAYETDMIWLLIDFPSEEIKRLTIKSLQSLPIGGQQMIPHLIQILTIAASPDEAGNSRQEVCVRIMKSSCTLSPPPTSKHASITTANMLYRKTDHLQPSEISLGMKARVVPHMNLHRLVYDNDRYEWYDRPSEEILQSLANQKVEVVSVADLKSKQRVGVKLVVSSTGRVICDAIPLESLLPCDQLPSLAEESENKTNEDNSKEQTKKRKKSIRKKSTLVQAWLPEKNLEDADQQGGGNNKDRRSSAMMKKLRKKIKQAQHDDEADRNQRDVDSLALSNLSRDEQEDVKTTKSTKPSTQQVEGDDEHFLPGPLAGDQSAPPPLEEVPDRRKPKASRPKSASSTIKVTATYDAREQQLDNIVHAPKDYSWLHSPTRQLHNQVLQLDMSAIPPPHQPPQHLEYDMHMEDVGSPRHDAQEHGTVHPMREAVFDSDHIEYSNGVYVQPPPGSPRNHPKKNRPTSANATKKNKLQASQINANRMGYNVDDIPPNTIGVAGAGFDKDHRKWNAPVIDFKLTDISEIPAARPTSATVGNKRPMSAKAMQEEVPLPPEDEKKGVMGVSLHVQTLQLSEHELSPSSRAHSKSPTYRMKGNKKSPRGDDDDEEEDEKITFGVKVKKSPKGKAKRPMSLQESLYYNREMARSEKEASRTEKVLLKELKRLGVQGNNLAPTSPDHRVSV